MSRSSPGRMDAQHEWLGSAGLSPPRFARDTDHLHERTGRSISAPDRARCRSCRFSCKTVRRRRYAAARSQGCCRLGSNAQPLEQRTELVRSRQARQTLASSHPRNTRTGGRRFIGKMAGNWPRNRPSHKKSHNKFANFSAVLCCSPTRRAPSRARGMGRGPIESLPQSFRKLEIVAENRAWSTAVTLRSFPFVPKHQQHIFHFCRISI